MEEPQVGHSLSKPKSIVYASNGYTVHDHRFLKFLIDYNWRVYFLRFDGLERQLENRELPVGVSQIDWLGTSCQLVHENSAEFIDAFQSLMDALRPEIILAGPITSVGFVCSHSQNAPTVLLSWAFDVLIEAKQNRTLHAAAQFALKSSAGVIFDSSSVAKSGKELGGKPETFLIVPWGIDLVEFSPSKKRNPDGVFRVVSLRSHEDIYDVKTLLKAADVLVRDYPFFSFSVSIYGSGSSHHDLLELADSLGLSSCISWNERVKEHEVREVLNSSDLYVSTSKSDGSSILMLQALALSQIVLVADIDSNIEWISDGINGFLFRQSDHLDLAARIFDISQSSSTDDIRKNAPTKVLDLADWRVNQVTIDKFLVSFL